VLIEGWIALGLTMLGFLTLLTSLWTLRKYNDAIFLGAHLLAISVTTVLYLSYQYYPFLIAAAAIVRARAELSTIQRPGTTVNPRLRISGTTRQVASRAA
jgi:hypothetical protein